jgi:hypothetical protein
MWQVHGRAVSGGSFPAAIFASVMRRALEGKAAEPILTAEPDDLDLRRLRPKSSWGRRPARVRQAPPEAPAVSPAPPAPPPP